MQPSGRARQYSGIRGYEAFAEIAHGGVNRRALVHDERHLAFGANSAQPPAHVASVVCGTADQHGVEVGRAEEIRTGLDSRDGSANGPAANGSCINATSAWSQSAAVSRRTASQSPAQSTPPSFVDERIVIAEEVLAGDGQGAPVRMPPPLAEDDERQQNDRAVGGRCETEERRGAYRAAAGVGPRANQRGVMIDVGAGTVCEQLLPARHEIGGPYRRPVAPPLDAPVRHALVATQLMRSPRSRSTSRRRNRASDANHSRSVAWVGSAFPSQTTVVSS